MNKKDILNLQGPILILGASGFIGSNLFRCLIEKRKDVYGTSSQLPAWRLSGLTHLIEADVLVENNLKMILDQVKPQTVFDFVAYGGYSFQNDLNLIYKTNVVYLQQLTELLCQRGVHRFIHAGSSSEYGENAAGPHEEDQTIPNSHYAVSKLSASTLLNYLGRHKKFPCANLRIYSAYGPYEDSARLIPQMIKKALVGEYPPFVNPHISRDFIYIDDVVQAFIVAALHLKESEYGASFNVGSGTKTSIGEIANLCKTFFKINHDPRFEMPNRSWDITDWYANIHKMKAHFNWTPQVSLLEGLKKTTDWYKKLPNTSDYEKVSKLFQIDNKHSVSAIVTIYKDAPAIPILYQRLTDVFLKLKIDYEIIFVNDNSPDESEKLIQEISQRDHHVIGINHSRNFGSQAAFRSGMELSRKSACVLLDGDLQDPPELIEKFVEQWKLGYDVVFGRRVKREGPLYMQIAYKLFYRLFDQFSYVRIPHDAGDFSLMDRKVVQAILKFSERDLFLRGIRAFAGFRQVGVDYTRPERMFGVSTNSFLKNIGWAKKGILSFSNTPLNILSFFSVVLLLASFLISLTQIILKLAYPELSPKGITLTILLIIFFGSCNLFALGLVGEYIAKIFEEVKKRPLFIRRSLIKDGQLHDRLINNDVSLSNDS